MVNFRAGVHAGNRTLRLIPSEGVPASTAFGLDLGGAVELDLKKKGAVRLEGNYAFATADSSDEERFRVQSVDGALLYNPNLPYLRTPPARLQFRVYAGLQLGRQVSEKDFPGTDNDVTIRQWQLGPAFRGTASLEIIRDYFYFDLTGQVNGLFDIGGVQERPGVSGPTKHLRFEPQFGVLGGFSVYL